MELLDHRSLNIDTLFSEQEMLKLESIRKSRTEEKRRTLRAAFLLDSLSGQSDETIAQHHYVSRSTVVLCIQKFLQFGLEAALGELPRPGQAAATAGLNLIENQFSKMTRTMLRGIRVVSKQELIDRIHQYFEEINAAPVVFRWKYKMDEIII